MISSSFLFPACFMSYHGQFLHATLTCWRLKRKSGVQSHNNYFYPQQDFISKTFTNWITRKTPTVASTKWITSEHWNWVGLKFHCTRYKSISIYRHEFISITKQERSLYNIYTIYLFYTSWGKLDLIWSWFFHLLALITSPAEPRGRFD